MNAGINKEIARHNKAPSIVNKENDTANKENAASKKENAVPDTENAIGNKSDAMHCKENGGLNKAIYLSTRTFSLSPALLRAACIRAMTRRTPI